MLSIDSFTLVADPTRRKILDLLRTRERDVATLVEELRLPQPLISKHLRVLRDAGAATSSADGKRRVYRLSADPLPYVLAWVAPYYRMWSASFDRLEEAMDEEEHHGAGR
jgi:DNA-binding transcriptional ArsR family regulator